MSLKRKLKKPSKDDEFEFDPIPKHLVTAHLKNQEKRLIIILEDAQLETVKVRKSPYTMLYYLNPPSIQTGRQQIRVTELRRSQTHPKKQ